MTTVQKLSPRSQAAWDAFRARVAELGGVVLESEWLGRKTPHRVRCMEGHECTPRPDDTRRGTGICRTCAGRDPKAAEAAFRARLKALNATLIEASWLGSDKPHRVICAQGHDCSPRPADLGRGRGICRACVGKDPRVAEAAFRARVAELGGVILEPKWLGNATPHRVRCVAGHECTPRPHGVRQGQGICRTCANRDTRATEAEFRARVAALGGQVVGAWQGSGVATPVRCEAGHACTPIPGNVLRGQGICGACARNDPRTAEAAFRARLDELGAILLEPKWLGNNSPHRVRCAQGHECTPRPTSVQQGGGICRTCVRQDPKVAEAAFRAGVEQRGGEVLGRWKNSATRILVRCANGHEVMAAPGQVRRGGGFCRVCVRQDPEAAEAAFRARVAELGGKVLGEWKNNRTPILIRCARGHERASRPYHVQQGGGICGICAGKAWDVFYVVGDEVNEIVKFGVTSGSPRRRLSRHARDGFDCVIRLVEDLPGDLAPRLERAVLAALRDARETPVRGREYFPARVLGLVLDVVDGWTGSSAPVDESEQLALDIAA